MARKKAKKTVKRSAAVAPPKLENEIVRDCELDIDRASLDAEKRTVNVSFSSETNEVRFFGTPQILLHEPKTMNLASLRRGAVLFHHDPNNIVGRTADVRLDEDRVGRATVVFDSDDEGDRALRKVQSGSLRGVSVGAKVQKWVRLGDDEEWQSPEGRTFRGPADLAVRWTPVEISLTPTPADGSVGVGRTQETGPMPTMAKQLREFLVRNGLDEDATEKEANEFLEKSEFVSRSEVDALLEAERKKAVKPEPKKDPAPALTKDDVKRAVEAERERVSAIRDLCRTYPETEKLESELIRDEVSIDVAREKCWDEMAKARPSLPNGAHRVEVVADGRDKFSEAAKQHLMLRTDNINERDNPKECELAREVDIFSLFDLARECLRRANVPSAGVQRDEIIKRAISHTSSDYPNILENVANKSMLRGWEEAASTWEGVAAARSVTDFKAQSRLKLGDSGDLIVVPEGAPMSEQTIPEIKESYSIATYARRFGLSRQAIINDDLDALSAIPSRMGAAARRLPNQLFYTELTSGTGENGPTMAEGSLQLFATTHASGDNLDATALALSALGTGRRKLRTVTGLAATGETAPTLNLVPDVLLVAADLEHTALQLVNDITPAVVTDSQPNWVRNLTVIVEPLIDANASATTWYLVSRGVEGGEVAFLNGQRQPTQVRVEGTNILGVEWGLYLDCGTKFVEHRGWYRGNA